MRRSSRGIVVVHPDPLEVPARQCHVVAVRAAGPEEQLDQLLAALPPHQQKVVTLRVGAGLSAEETAGIVGGTAEAVRLTQHRALNQLRRMLAEADS